jgi:hypothetical protein
MREQALAKSEKARIVLSEYQALLESLAKEADYGLFPIARLNHSKVEIKKAILLQLRDAVLTDRLDERPMRELEACYCSLAHFVEDGKIRSINRYLELLDRGGFKVQSEEMEFCEAAACAVESARALHQKKELLSKEFAKYRELFLTSGPQVDLIFPPA